MAKQQASANVGIVRSKPPTSTATTTKDQMIAEAAYYIAQQRGFQGGDPVQDWLKAEAQIEQLLKKRH